jgi:peroxiredoxin Q/BCP
MIKEGSQAPDFSLEGSDGKMHSLAEFRGRVVVLYFYPRDDTPGCTIEAKGFNEQIGEIEKKNAVVIGVSKDGPESHQKFKNKYLLGFLLLSDPESITIKAYDSYGNKGIFGWGTLRRTFIIGEDGKVRKIFDKVSPKGHAGEVLSCIG